VARSSRPGLTSPGCHSIRIAGRSHFDKLDPKAVTLITRVHGCHPDCFGRSLPRWLPGTTRKAHWNSSSPPDALRRRLNLNLSINAFHFFRYHLQPPGCIIFDPSKMQLLSCIFPLGASGGFTSIPRERRRRREKRRIEYCRVACSLPPRSLPRAAPPLNQSLYRDGRSKYVMIHLFMIRQ
jgi:hypothetical protein